MSSRRVPEFLGGYNAVLDLHRCGKEIPVLIWILEFWIEIVSRSSVDDVSAMDPS